MVTEELRSLIAASIPCAALEVAGDGVHFQVLVVSEEFDGLSRVRRHQLVYKALGDRMREEIHALSLRAHTPEEWRARNG